MKRISLVLAGLILGSSLNAATLATMNGKNVSDTEVGEFFNVPKLASLKKEQQQAFTQQYIVTKLIAQDAKAQKLEKDPIFAKELEKAKEGILVALYQQKIFNSVKVDAAKVKKFYDDNKDKFVRPAQVQASHILVSSEADAKSLINEMKNLKGKKLEEKFIELAKNKSIDQNSAQNGGELGWFDQSTMIKDFTDAAFSLKNGQITTTPVKTNFGYHIIYKKGAKAKEQISFNDKKAEIENLIKNEETQVLLSKKIKELGDKAKVEIK